MGLEPRKDTRQIIDLLRLSQSRPFYLEAHPKLAPVNTATDGVFRPDVPRDRRIFRYIAQAKGAASSALTALQRQSENGAQISFVNESTCRDAVIALKFAL